MQGNQKTLESFDEKHRTESEGYRAEAISIDAAQSMEEVTYDGLIEKVVDDDNIDTALRREFGSLFRYF